MVITTSKNKVQEYFDSEALNQSSLKKLNMGLDKYLADLNKEEGPEKDYFLIGSAVDVILTGEEGQFEEEFYVSKLEKKPSEMEMNIIKQVFDKHISWLKSLYLEGSDIQIQIPPLSDFEDYILEATNFYGWQPKWKEETRINKIIEVGSEYFEDLKASFGKKILSADQKYIIDSVVYSFKNNDRVKHLFDRSEWNSTQNIHIYYQLPLYFEIENVPCKCLFDILIVHLNEDGEVIKMVPIDVKTTSQYTINFPTAAKSYRYDIQAAWYTDALRNPTTIFPEDFPTISKDVEIAPFEFVVESTTSPGKPLIFRTTDSFIEVGRNGVYDEANNKLRVRGYKFLLDMYIYYQNTNWREEKVVTESNGILELGWDGLMFNGYEY